MKEELEDEFLFFITGAEELLQVRFRIANYFRRRERHLFENRFGYASAVLDEECAHGLRDVVTRPVSEIFLVLAKEAAKPFNEVPVDFAHVCIRFEFGQEAKAALIRLRCPDTKGHIRTCPDDLRTLSDTLDGIVNTFSWAFFGREITGSA